MALAIFHAVLQILHKNRMFANNASLKVMFRFDNFENSSL